MVLRAWHRSARSDGFTLIELLVVVLIVGILIAVAAPSFLSQSQKATDSAAKQYLTYAWKAAKADAVSNTPQGAYSTGSALVSAIQTSEPELTVALGSTSCPGAADTNPKDVFIDPASTSSQIILCNDPNHTVWTLTATQFGPPVFTVDRAAVVGVSAPTNTAPPTISGTAAYGNTLTAQNGTWTSSPTFSYQWLRDGSAISAATAQTYALSGADVGHSLSVTVTGTNAAGSAAATSSAVSVSDSAPVYTGSPNAVSISGTAQSGQTLTANAGSWSSGATPTYTYQWLSCDSTGANCANYGAASSSNTLVPVATDTGKTIRVVVTAQNSAGSTSSPQSAPTAQVAGPYYNTVLSDSPTNYWRLDTQETLFTSSGAGYNWHSQAYGYTPTWYAALGSWSLQNYSNTPTLQTSTGGCDATYGDCYAILNTAVPTAHTIMAQLLNNNASDAPNPGLVVNFTDGCNFDAIYFATSSHQMWYYNNRGCSPAAGVLVTNSNITQGSWMHVAAASDGHGNLAVTLNGAMIYRSTSGGWLNSTHAGAWSRSPGGLAGWVDNIHLTGGMTDSVGTATGNYMLTWAYAGTGLGVAGALADGDLAANFITAGDSVVTEYKPSPPSAFTWEAWVKRATAPTPGAALIVGIYGGWEIVTDTNCHAETAYYGTDAAWHYTIGTSNICDSNWHLVTGTWDGSTIKVYVDGALQSSTASTTGTANQTATPYLNGYVQIGHQTDGTTADPGAYIDDVSYYTKALSATQVAAHYAARNH